jgi:hypothetical protein
MTNIADKLRGVLFEVEQYRRLISHLWNNQLPTRTELLHRDDTAKTALAAMPDPDAVGECVEFTATHIHLDDLGDARAALAKLEERKQTAEDDHYRRPKP